MPTSAKASFTSSNLNGFMIASIFFMAVCSDLLPLRTYSGMAPPTHVGNDGVLRASAKSSVSANRVTRDQLSHNHFECSMLCTPKSIRNSLTPFNALVTFDHTSRISAEISTIEDLEPDRSCPEYFSNESSGKW
jgi:hypothetical protein